MIKILSNKYLLFAFRTALALIFIFAGMEKIVNPSGFSDSIANYKLLPLSFINIFAIVIPWIEIAAGLMLLFGAAVKENAFIINSLMVVFILAIAISVARGLNIDCGCFGTQSGAKVGFVKLIENIGILAMGILVMIFGASFLSVERKDI